MPLTPLHLGPAAVVKVILPGYFSFSVFAFVQVLIDLEPLYYMAIDADPLHRFMHTFAGSTVAAALGVVLGRPLCVAALKWWNMHLDAQLARWLATDQVIPLIPAVTGAAVGAYSHLALDAIMHMDVRPLAPFSQDNLLHGLISIDGLYWFCAATGLLGLVVGIAYRIRQHLRTSQR